MPTRRLVAAALGSSPAWLAASNLAAAAPREKDAEQALWAYTDKVSYRPGEAVRVHASGPKGPARVRLVRLGGTDEDVAVPGRFEVRPHDTPQDASEQGCGWPEAFAFEVRALRSGYYRLIVEQEGRTAEHAMIVRPARPSGGIAMPLSMNTMHAYNWWGGKNLYEDVDPDDIRAPGQQRQGGRTAARFISTQRPFAPGLLRGHSDSPRFPNMRPRGFREAPFYEGVRYVAQPGYSRWDFAAGYENKWEHHLARWLESRGHQVDYFDQSDMGREPGLLSPYKLYVTAGHNEYVSWEERDEVERFVGGGGNALMLSGNHAFWQVRWEEDGTRLVGYKSSATEEDPAFLRGPRERTTTYWSSPITGRPETEMTGLTFSRGGFANLGLATARGSGGYTVYRPEHWAFEGADLFYGDVLGAKDRLVGWEVDGCAFTFRDGLPYPTGEDGAPEDMTILAMAPASFERGDCGYPGEGLLMGGDYEGLAAGLYGEATAETVARVLQGHVMMVAFRRGEDGGEVFNTGCCEWPYGLRSGDPMAVRITNNVLTRFLA